MAKDKKDLGLNTFKRLDPTEKKEAKPKRLQGNDIVKYSLNVDQKQLAEIKALSKKTGISIRRLFAEALHNYLNEAWPEERMNKYLDWKKENPFKI